MKDLTTYPLSGRYSMQISNGLCRIFDNSVEEEQYFLYPDEIRAAAKVLDDLDNKPTQPEYEFFRNFENDMIYRRNGQIIECFDDERWFTSAHNADSFDVLIASGDAVPTSDPEAPKPPALPCYKDTMFEGVRRNNNGVIELWDDIDEAWVGSLVSVRGFDDAIKTGDFIICADPSKEN